MDIPRKFGKKGTKNQKQYPNYGSLVKHMCHLYPINQDNEK